jgi:hypothetical protein
MSLGKTATPPLLAIVWVILFPDTAFMLDTTIGMLVPNWSGVTKLVSNLELIVLYLGTKNISL